MKCHSWCVVRHGHWPAPDCTCSSLRWHKAPYTVIPGSSAMSARPRPCRTRSFSQNGSESLPVAQAFDSRMKVISLLKERKDPFCT